MGQHMVVPTGDGMGHPATMNWLAPSLLFNRSFHSEVVRPPKPPGHWSQRLSPQLGSFSSAPKQTRPQNLTARLTVEAGMAQRPPIAGTRSILRQRRDCGHLLAPEPADPKTEMALARAKPTALGGSSEPRLKQVIRRF